MLRRIAGVALGCALSAGCVQRPTPGDGSESSSGTGVGESSGAPTTSAAGTTGLLTGTSTGEATGTTGGTTSGSTSGEDTCGFVCGTTGAVVESCDVLEQDCPEGEKCAAYVDDSGDWWNATRCVPVSGDGQPGEACTAPGMGMSGLDDCAKGAMCWDVDEDHGTCMALCTGTEAAPLCAADFACLWSTNNHGYGFALSVCLPTCDPLVTDCADDEVCIPYIDEFMCRVGRSPPGQLFEPCEYLNACDKGLLCGQPANAIECEEPDLYCCLPFCDVTDPNFVCPGVGQECLSLYDEGMAPPKYAKVGICALPG